MAAGQLATSSGTILTGSTAPFPLAVLLFNTNTTSETVVLEYTPSGGSKQTLCSVPLGANETLVLSGLIFGPGDVVSGYSTSASKVNYFTMQSAAGLSLTVTDSAGGKKQVNSASNLTGAQTITSTSATALVVGANGATNPVFNVNANTASVATGITIVGAAAAGGVAIQVLSSGTNEALKIDAKAAATVTINGTSASATGVNIGSATAAAGTVLNVTSTNAAALTVGRQGATNPVLAVDASASTVVTGIVVTGGTAAAGVAIQVTSSGANEALSIDAKAAAAVTINGAAASALGVNIGSATAAAGTVLTVTSTNAAALAVGRQGATAPALLVNANTASSATGISIVSAAAAGGVAVAAISSGTNESLTVDAKGSGTITLNATATGGVVIGSATGRVVTLAGTLTSGGLLGAALQVCTSGPLIYSGSGAPSISAAVAGSLYLRTDGSSTSTRLYVASDTAGAWVAVTTAS